MTLASNLNLLREDIARLAVKFGREPQSIRLVAVSKTKPLADIIAAYQAQQIDFAENYAQEFRDKFKALGALPLTWHFIGHLQSNKSQYVVGQAHLIHTLDRLSLAQTIQKIARKKNIIQKCLIEVKISADKNKTGCSTEELPQLLRALKDLDHIDVLGLMTVASLSATRQQVQQEYQTLQRMRDELNHNQDYRHPLTELSMGMSHDYEDAIAAGATIIRVGTKIFGERK